ncbi:MAG: long-chain acyl-CoA synthetase (AMP-forming) [Myxococcaceae bacterium]|nr:long-chain acyl-CoA synthetase (AMP-forming) [Myxococcaceae bacterium]
MKIANTQLESLYDFEERRKNDRWLVQPMGGGVVKELTFGEAMDQARRMASHLKSLNLPEKSNIAIFSKNTAWWLMTDIAIWMAGHVSVPLYPTLTPETIGQILDHSGAKLIFIGKLDGFPAMQPGIPKSLPQITLPLAPPVEGAPSWETLIAAQQPLEGKPLRPATDLATIVYTSGSTGVPKGVMHSFATMVASDGLASRLEVKPEDRMLSYLPLAHVFERTIVETGTFMRGMTVFFAQSLETFVEDLKRARPTLFISVPRLWLKFQAGVFDKMPPKKLDRLLGIPLVGTLVRKKVLKGLGLDQVRFAGSGSAPIPAEVLHWYRKLGLELLEGYGMSENFSYSHMTRPGEVRVGFVGRAHDDCQARLGEGNEIQVKSPCTMLGYFKAPEMTAEMFTPDGFLKTGDQGEIDEKGNLKITGRVKELFKTSKGKYVAPSPIENRLLLHPDVEQACVSGAGQGQPYGLVVLSLKARNQVSSADHKARLEAELKEHLATVNKALDPHEQLEVVVVLAEEWTTENGMLTPTMKLRRHAIEKKYNDRVDGWYGEKKEVLWA